MKLTQNLNRWMNSDSSPLQGKLAAELINKKDKDECPTEEPKQEAVETAGNLLNHLQHTVLSFP
ncbi:hypothetical protein Bca101_025022 [Brassica carinata]